MATLVGTQSKFEDALYELCELDFDAAEAYEAAANRLKNEEYKAKMLEFEKDHRRHIEEITDFLKNRNAKAPDGPSAKSLLTQGKVVLANILGDKSILQAMHSNEEDTNKAYERLNKHSEKPAEAEDMLSRGFEDEKKHKEWLETTLEEHKED